MYFSSAIALLLLLLPYLNAKKDSPHKVIALRGGFVRHIPVTSRDVVPKEVISSLALSPVVSLRLLPSLLPR